MTDEQIEAAYKEMIAMWGDKLPNPEHEPIRFGYYVRLYRYIKERNNVE